MSQDDQIRKLTEIAYMYYIDGMSQNDIAKEFSISRSMVSLMLSEAKAKEIVKIEIKDAGLYCFDLQRKLERIFKLKKAIVVPEFTKTIESKVRLLGDATARYLSQILEDNMTIGVSWGITINEVANRVKNTNKSNLTVTPLIGGIANEMSHLHSNVIANTMAKRLGGKSLGLYAPVFVSIKEVKDVIFKDISIKNVFEKGESADIAIVGIGSIQNSTMYSIGCLNNKDYEDLQKCGAVGDFSNWFFDKDGQYIDAEITERTIAVARDKIAKIPLKIAVAGGVNKKEAIHAALKGKLMDVLITDEGVARDIISEYENHNIALQL